MKNIKPIVVFIAASLLFLVSCTEDGTQTNNPSRGDTTDQPEGITIDTTWGEETEVGF